MKKLFLIIMIAFTNLVAFSQYDNATSGSTIEKTMRSDGKIYVVVAVCLTILFGLIIYLVRLDRKITKLEK